MTIILGLIMLLVLSCARELCSVGMDNA